MDAVRCLTNHSTGELGAVLAGELAAAGFRVLCLKGSGAVARFGDGYEIKEFQTNDDLRRLLEEVSRGADVGAVFHAAALSDFEVCRDDLPSLGKLKSDAGGLTLRLRPAEKILPHLRGWFPDAFLVGWKFEVDGSVEEARQRARDQLAACASDLCVLNGPAAGRGFTVIAPDGSSQDFPDKPSLAAGLVRWIL